tara:strand:+ start:3268 stop:4065 length:798 start_codon:yes stop_codon:yes gene_type:complete
MAFYIGSDKVIDSSDSLTYQSSGGRGFENYTYYGDADSDEYGVASDDQILNGANSIFNPRETGEGWRNYYDGYLGAGSTYVFDLEDLYLLSGISHREDNVHYFNIHDVFSKIGSEATNIAPKITFSTSTTERTSLYSYAYRGLSGITTGSGWERNSNSGSASSIPLLPYTIDTTTSAMNKVEMINFEIWLYDALDADIITTLKWKAMFIAGSNTLPSVANGNIWIEGVSHYRDAEKHTKMNFIFGGAMHIDNLIVAGAQTDYTPT